MMSSDLCDISMRSCMIATACLQRRRSLCEAVSRVGRLVRLRGVHRVRAAALPRAYLRGLLLFGPPCVETHAPTAWF